MLFDAQDVQAFADRLQRLDAVDFQSAKLSFQALHPAIRRAARLAI
jgi:hypothetical protein